MQFIFNIIIITILAILFVVEQRRYTTLQTRVALKRKELIALSHELRGPFIVLKKYNAFLLQKEFGKLTLAQVEVLNRMEQASSDVLVALNRMLAASRLEEGEMPSEIGKIDVRDSIHAALDALEGMIVSRNHSVVLNVPSRPVWLVTDPLLLHGVLDELLQNAAVYTPAEGVITITLRQNKDTCSIDIADTGIGITKEEQTHIFLNFYRGTRAFSMHDGHGLGLPFAQQFAKRLKGKVELVRSSRKGSVFRVTFVKTPL